MPLRLIERRTPPTEAMTASRGQDPLFAVYDYHPLITDRTGDLLDLEADHRRHAEVELTIRDLKNALAVDHFPTKSFGGNAAWLILNTIASNLTRWTARLALGQGLVMTKTIRPTHLHRGRATGPHLAEEPSCGCHVAGPGPSRSSPRSPGTRPTRCQRLTPRPVPTSAPPGEAGQTGRTRTPTPEPQTLNTKAGDHGTYIGGFRLRPAAA